MVTCCPDNVILGRPLTVLETIETVFPPHHVISISKITLSSLQSSFFTFRRKPYASHMLCQTNESLSQVTKYVDGKSSAISNCGDIAEFYFKERCQESKHGRADHFFPQSPSENQLRHDIHPNCRINLKENYEKYGHPKIEPKEDDIKVLGS